MAERLMIFIDGSNLYHSLKNHFGRTDLDVRKFCSKLKGRRNLTRIYYYNAKVGFKEEPERFRQQQSFFASINAIPYTELRLGRLVYTNWPHTPPYEKGIDVQLATDMLTHSFKDNYDVAILVAGDNARSHVRHADIIVVSRTEDVTRLDCWQTSFGHLAIDDLETGGALLPFIILVANLPRGTSSGYDKS